MGVKATPEVHRARLSRFDHLPSKTAYDRLNRRLAIRITGAVGSMSCAYVFAVIALISLPAAISTHSVIIIVAWVAQTLLQLVLLAVIIVGQNIAGEASDARAVRTFDDAEEIKAKTADLLVAVTRVEAAQVKIVEAINRALDPGNANVKRRSRGDVE